MTAQHDDNDEAADDLEDGAAELDEEVLDDEELDPDALGDAEIVEDFPDDDAVVDDSDDDDDDAPAAKKRGADEEEEEDDEDPDDVEADLDTILKDRLAHEDEEEDEEEETTAAVVVPAAAAGVSQKKADEFPCPSCFLLISPGRSAPGDAMTCPQCGDDIIVPA